jgi:thiol:disulfide interchange protein
MYRPTRFTRLLGALALLAAGLLPLAAPAQLSSGPGAVVTTEQVRAELLAHAPQGAGPGQTVWVGLQIRHKPEWHTYWKNSGDSGLPTQLQWTLPAGVTAGEIQWPLPQKIRIGTLANYGYEGTVLLPVQLTIGPEFRPGLLSDAIDVKLAAAWLVCKTECIPEEGQFALKIPVKSSTASQGSLFDAAWRSAPTELARTDASALRIDGQFLRLSIPGLPAQWQGRTLEFYPESPEVIETAARWQQAWDGAAWTARIPLSSQRSNSPALMPVVLALEGQGRRIELSVSGSWPQTGGAAQTSTTLQAALAAGPRDGGLLTGAPAASIGFWAALLGALIGGLILNLMPCVLPVLAIKVLGFARHADDRRAHRINGIAYTAGVLLSFMALGLLMLSLRQAGESLGWGFQLQNPAVVAALALLFTLIGLNLAGVFQFRQMVPSGLATFQPRHPVVDAFFTGVLAVAIASPCTAPFMGASLGLAVALPPWQAMAVFATLGLGLALPYLAASFIPAVARALPRPGAWMDTLKTFMAFPMFATVAWLVWVLGQQSGINGAGALLALLVAVAFVAWAMAQTGRARLVTGAVSLALLLTLGWSLGPTVTTLAPVAQQVRDGRWQAWAPGKVEQITAAGQPVFVDFTAAWCVTCQYNKQTTLSDPQLLADMDARKVVLLRADWTRRDPAITAALQQLGRNGVPVYVLYQDGRAPQVLSEILSVQDVRAALARL